jgi:hypothetical protein
MTKEQKTELQFINKEVQNIIKQVSKKKSCKIVSNCIYEKIYDYFVHGVIFVRFINNQYLLTVGMNIKLYNYDDIFWNVIDLKDNIHQKDSLRANGAFVAPSIQWKEKTYIIANTTCIEQICSNLVDDFKYEGRSFIEKIISEYNNFDSFALHQSGILDEKLIKILANINKKMYADAETIAQSELNQGHGGRFQNKGIGINEYVLVYCRMMNNN